MIGEVLKSLLSDAYDAWYTDRLSGETYKELAALVTDKADELLKTKSITDDEWYEIHDENISNLMLVDDVAEI